MYKEEGAGIRVKLVGRKRRRESTTRGHGGLGGQRSPKRQQIQVECWHFHSSEAEKLHTWNTVSSGDSLAKTA